MSDYIQGGLLEWRCYSHDWQATGSLVCQFKVHGVVQSVQMLQPIIMQFDEVIIGITYSHPYNSQSKEVFIVGISKHKFVEKSNLLHLTFGSLNILTGFSFSPTCTNKQETRNNFQWIITSTRNNWVLWKKCSGFNRKTIFSYYRSPIPFSHWLYKMCGIWENILPPRWKRTSRLVRITSHWPWN